MLCASLLLALASTAVLPAPTDGRVKAAIQQARDGLLEAAVAGFDTVIAELVQAGPAGRADLIVAHVHRGAALVALQNEAAAKEAFGRALTLEPALRLPRGEFPDRVIRIFDAARTGKTKSVMERPSGAPKKAGLGAAGVAAIVGGGVLLAGGIAVAAAGGDPSASPTPAPSPTPDPASQVTPVPGSASGPVRFEIVALSPPSGSTMSGCTNRGCTIQAQIRVSSTIGYSNLRLQAYNDGAAPCVSGFSDRFDINANVPFVVAMPVTGTSCALPLSITTLWLIQQSAPAQSVQAFNLRYTMTP